MKVRMQWGRQPNDSGKKKGSAWKEKEPNEIPDRRHVFYKLQTPTH